MLRKIIEINEEKCTGCGLCAKACHEGAIAMVNGKAKLMRDDYCDGMGDCLPACPAGAISFTEREAAAYDAAAVQRAKAEKQKPPDCACPGTMAKTIRQEAADCCADAPSRLSNWPVQIRLAPVKAPYYAGADLLIAADCTAYACGGFHERFIKGRVTLVGCPKLDGVNYADKLSQILEENDIRGIVLTRMEVPCCGGLEFAVKRAIEWSGKEIPLQVVTISADGEIPDV